MLNETLNDCISKISSIMRIADIDKIGDKCLNLVRWPRGENTNIDDRLIFSYMVLMRNEPLDAKLSLPHKIFVALDKIC